MFTVYSAYTRANQKVVVINPGHSMGYDSGATSPYISEAQVNQEVAGKVVRQLNSLGYKVYITHTTDIELQNQKLLSQRDASYLRNVGPAMKTVNPDLTISIHHNSGGTSSSGYELYWSSYRDYDTEGVYTVPGLWSTGELAYRDSSPRPEATRSKEFAECMKRHLDGEPNLAFRKIVERNDYVPAHSTCPSILYEGGYLSNPSEAQYLSTEAYKIEAANRITAAINEFLGGSGGTGTTTTPTSNDRETPRINNVYSSATNTSSLEFSLEANVSDNVGVSVVRFATWTEANGQDDIVWKEGTNNGNGTFSCSISATEHNMESGSYITHVYAYDAAGNYTAVEAPRVTISGQAVRSGVSVEKLNSSMAVAYANNLGSTNGYKFAVWSEKDGQDDIVWTQGTQMVGNCYKSVINRSDHKNDYGKYFVHVYTNSEQFVGANEVNFNTVTGTVQVSDNNGNIEVNATNLVAPDGIRGLNVAVWTENNGQDDLKWYAMDKVTDNSYRKLVPAAEHGGNGLYNAHVYLVDNYNLQQMVDGKAIQISSANTVANNTQNLGPIKTTIGGQTGNTIQVTVNNVPGDKTILVPTWSDQNGQDDLVWYEAQNAGNNTFIGTINLANHRGNGTYHIHIYTRDINSGAVTIVGEYTTQVNAAASAPASQKVSVNTPIMGNVGTNASQLAQMYTKHAGHEFPNYYVARGVSLNQFCQMYVDECATENVRADIAFAQAMEETAFLGFGGDVSISQFNFAGLGATGGGVAGENFAARHGDNANGIRMGIRAQIQHLKAYASTDPLVNQCIDTRFSYVSRGRATTINGLSGTWAADKNYAPKIVTICNYIYS